MNTKIKCFLCLICSYSLGYSQTGKITGKLNRQDIENKSTIIENTFVLLKYKTVNDSVKINENLSFEFEKLPADTFTITFSRRSYPYDERYSLSQGWRNSEHRYLLCVNMPL